MKHLALISCLALAACGGGGSGSEPPTASTCRDTATVVLLGDSTMTPWPRYYLMRELADKYGAGRVTVADRAVPGTDSAQFLSGADGHHGLAEADGADLVVLNHGQNDMQHGLPVAEYEQRLQSIRTAIGSRLLLQTPNPNFSTPEREAALPAYVDAMRRQGAAIDAYAYFQTLPDWRALMPDGIHPNRAGQQAIVRGAMAPAVEAALDMCGAPK